MNLKFAMVIFLALFTYAGRAVAMGSSKPEPKTPAQVSDEWGKYVRCDRDDDCMLIRGVCYGLVAVNRGLKNDAESYIARKKPKADCAPPDPSRNPLSAVCSDHRCKEVFPLDKKQ